MSAFFSRIFKCILSSNILFNKIFSGVWFWLCPTIIWTGISSKLFKIWSLLSNTLTWNIDKVLNVPAPDSIILYSKLPSVIHSIFCIFFWSIGLSSFFWLKSVKANQTNKAKIKIPIIIHIKFLFFFFSSIIILLFN